MTARDDLAMKRLKPVLVFLLASSACLRFLGLGDARLHGDEAYYWCWSRCINPPVFPTGFYDHPPGVAYMIWASTLFGLVNDEFMVRWASSLFGVATVYMVFLLGRRLYGSRAGLLAAILAGVNPALVLLSRLATPDAPLLFFFTLCLYLFWRAVETESDRMMICTGLVLGLGMNFKYPMILLFPVFFLHLLLYHRGWFRRRALYLSFLVFLMVFSPVIVWNVQKGFASFRYQGAHLAAKIGLDLTYYFVAYLWIFSVPLLVVLWLGVLYALRKHRERDVLMISALSVVYLCFSISQQRLFHWAIPIFIPMSVVTSSMLTDMGRRVSRRRKTFKVLVIISTIFLGYMIWHSAHLSTRFAQSMNEAAVTYVQVGAYITKIRPSVPDSIVVSENYWIASQVEYYSGVVCYSVDRVPFHSDYRPIPPFRNVLIVTATGALVRWITPHCEGVVFLRAFGQKPVISVYLALGFEGSHSRSSP